MNDGRTPGIDDGADHRRKRESKRTVAFDTKRKLASILNDQDDSTDAEDSETRGTSEEDVSTSSEEQDGTSPEETYNNTSEGSETDEQRLERAISLSLSKPCIEKGKLAKEGSRDTSCERRRPRYRPSVSIDEDLIQHTFSVLTEGKGFFEFQDLHRVALELGMVLEEDAAKDMISTIDPRAQGRVDVEGFLSLIRTLYDPTLKKD